MLIIGIHRVYWSVTWRADSPYMLQVWENIWRVRYYTVKYYYPAIV